MSLHDILTFCERHRMAHTDFGRRALRDPCLVNDMRNGRRLRRRTQFRVKNFMEKFR